MKNQMCLQRVTCRVSTEARDPGGRPGRGIQRNSMRWRIIQFVAASLLALLGLCLVPMSQAGAVSASANAADAGSTVAGSYSGGYGLDGTSTPVSLYVTPDGTAIEDVSTQVVMVCPPSHNAFGPEFVIDSLPLPASGTFGTTSTQTGVAFGYPAKFKLNLQGQLTTPSSPSVPTTMTGSLTESMTYTSSGKKYSCTTDKLPWSAQRDIQPTQTQSTTPPGNYSASIGLSNTTTPFTFTVAPDGTTIEAFKTDTPDNDLDCSPGDSGYTQEFDIDSLPIPASGTFETKGTQTGTFVGNPAKFTFDFQGHVHGLNSSFQPRLAGSLTESLTYTASGVTYTCTTDKLPWFATGTSLAPTTTVLVPAAGAKPLSGSTFLDASASNATSVQFWLVAARISGELRSLPPRFPTSDGSTAGIPRRSSTALTSFSLGRSAAVEPAHSVSL